MREKIGFSAWISAYVCSLLFVGGRVRARNGAPVCSDFRNGAE